MANLRRVRLLGAAAVAALSILVVSATATQAAVVETVEYIYPDPNTIDSGPDPTLWASSGGLAAGPNGNQGWEIVDPDNNASLLYFHSSAFLSNPGTAATFRGTVKNAPVADSSSAWSNDTTGFRLIIDDGQKRLILGLGRDPVTKARQVVVIGAVTVAPVPFNWETNFHHVYEVGKLPNGDFTFSVTNGDPASADPPVTQVVPAASLPASTGLAMFAWGMGAAGGGNSNWLETRGEVFTEQIDIGLDTRRLEFDLAESEITWKGEITLPPGVTLSPTTETMTITLANNSGIVFEYSIPAGGFIKKKRKFRFESPSGASPEVVVRLRQRGASSFRFKVTVEAASLTVADRTSMTGTIAFSNKIGNQTVPLTDRGDRLVFVRMGADDDND